MTKEATERITGLEAHIAVSAHGVHAIGLLPDGSFVLGFGATEDEAYEDLVTNNLSRVCDLVAKRQNYRCADCGMIRPLQFHHIKHRSEERDDRPQNIVGLCQYHHRKRHMDAQDTVRHRAVAFGL